MGFWEKTGEAGFEQKFIGGEREFGVVAASRDGK